MASIVMLMILHGRLTAIAYWRAMTNSPTNSPGRLIGERVVEILECPAGTDGGWPEFLVVTDKATYECVLDGFRVRVRRAAGRGIPLPPSVRNAEITESSRTARLAISGWPVDRRSRSESRMIRASCRTRRRARLPLVQPASRGMLAACPE